MHQAAPDFALACDGALMHETFTAVVSIAVAAVSAFVASLGAWAV